MMYIQRIKTFTHIPKMSVNSLYLLFGQSKESNTRFFFQALAVGGKQSSDSYKKNIIYDL